MQPYFDCVVTGDQQGDGDVPAQCDSAAVWGGLSVRGQARLLQPHTQRLHTTLDISVVSFSLISVVFLNWCQDCFTTEMCFVKHLPENPV